MARPLITCHIRLLSSVVLYEAQRMKEETTMDEQNQLVERFEAERPQLQAMAYWMLGPLAEAEDAIQESWFHLIRSDRSSIKNLGAWLTTTVTRICMDMLRSRQSRRKEFLSASDAESHNTYEHEIDPEQEVLLADAVGHALLVVLDTLSPAERIAFVLHDLFAIPFDEIAGMPGRSPMATRQLASRARRRVPGATAPQPADLTLQRKVVTAFLAASRAGDFKTLLTMLDPEVVFQHENPDMLPAGALKGAEAVARGFIGRVQGAHLAIVNSSIAITVTLPGGQLLVATFTIIGDKITKINTISDPDRVHKLNITMLDD
jgi:RNA polymerase sigma-70 factor (ECF subfamily)